MPLLEDTVLEDRYRIDGLLAYGGMSAVYRAYDVNLEVAVGNTFIVQVAIIDPGSPFGVSMTNAARMSIGY